MLGVISRVGESLGLGLNSEGFREVVGILVGGFGEKLGGGASVLKRQVGFSGVGGVGV